MKWALVDSDDIVRNIIIYEESLPYTCPEWLTLTEINDWVNIGDNKDIPEPLPLPDSPP